jgi:hypothetical protein
MKKPPPQPKANLANFFAARRMERAGLLRPGTAVVLATLPATKKPQNRGKPATVTKGRK